jgi:hypothetical protein
MQGAIRQTMEGRNGLEGWQWVSILGAKRRKSTVTDFR